MRNKNLSGRGQLVTQKGESATRNDDNGRVAIAVEPSPAVPAGNAVPDPMPQPITEKRKRFKLLWPTIVVGALAGQPSRSPEDAGTAKKAGRQSLRDFRTNFA
jgi:hypothetical protein